MRYDGCVKNAGPADLPFLVLPVADRVEEEVLSRARAGGGAALGLGLLTVRDLERRLFAAAGLAPLDPLGAELLAGAVAPEAARGTSLALVAEEPGFARAFLAVYDALREGGCGRAEMALLARKIGGLTGRRLSAVERIAAAYDEACEARGLIDAAGARLVLADRLDGAELPPDLARASGVVVEDVLDLPAVRVRMLAALARRGVPVSLRLPAVEGRAGLAASLEVQQRAVEGEGRGAVSLGWKRYGDGALAGFAERLFDSDRAPVADAPVELIEGDDPTAELRAIAGVVRKRLEAGAAPDEIWIAARNLSTMRDALGRALDAQGIPWRDRRGPLAVEAPPIRVALALVEAAERGVPRESLAEILTSRYVQGGVPAEGEAPFVPARDVVEALREAASRDDRGAGHGARVRAWARRLAERGDRRAPRVERIAAFLERIVPVIHLPASATLAGYGQRLASALEELGVTGKSAAAEEFAPGFAEVELEAVDRAAAAAMARDQAALRSLATLLSSLAGAARRVGLADREMPIARFRGLIEAVLAQTGLPSRGARGGAVRLVDVSELPGRSCAHLILAGVVEGRFPALRRSEPLLEESDREAINLAAGRPIFRWRAAEEPLLFALACASARESLVITGTRHDADGREVPRSPFLEEAIAASGREVRREAAAVVPPLDRCATKEELLARAALIEGGGYGPEDDVGAVRSLRQVEAIGGALDRARELAARGFGGAGAGQLGDARARAAVEARLRRGGEAAWVASVTALEEYAACPFRFLARRLLDLPELQGGSDELDAREGGTLLHAVVAAAFASLQQHGLLPLEGGPRAEREREVALAAVDDALDSWSKAERVGPDAFWTLKRDEARRTVARLLEAELRADSPLVPFELEKPFGEGEEPALLLPSPDGREAIALRGRVDRVDRTPDGGAVEVIDYKSGRVDGKVDAEELARSSFQLPIYAAWAKKRYGAERVDASLRSLRDGDGSTTLVAACEKKQIPLGSMLELDPERRAAARMDARVEPAAGALELPTDGDANLADNAWAFLAGMRAGRFDVKPHRGRKTCEWCSYGTVCRVAEAE